MFRNEYLSYSRVARFAQCKHAFKLHYVDRLPAEPSDSLVLGKLVHAVLEQLLLDHVREERVGRIERSAVRAAWKLAATEGGLADPTLFAEGLAMVEQAVRDEGAIDARNVIGIEHQPPARGEPVARQGHHPFRLRAGRFDVVGFIDRVDAVDDETVRVIDYKSNRLLFTDEEVDQSLQMSLYDVAVRQQWPWVRRVELCFVMLRHGVRLTTTRTPTQLATALDYIESVGEQSERETAFEPTLNANCGYCDHRGRCAAYADALAGRRTSAGTTALDLDAVAREREEVARLAKLLYARRNELDQVLLAQLEHHDEVVAGGIRYRMLPAPSKALRAERVVPFLARVTGRDEGTLRAELAFVDRKAAEAIVAEVGSTLPVPQARLLRAELEALGAATPGQRLVGTVVSP